MLASQRPLFRQHRKTGPAFQFTHAFGERGKPCIVQGMLAHGLLDAAPQPAGLAAGAAVEMTGELVQITDCP